MQYLTPNDATHESRVSGVIVIPGEYVETLADWIWQLANPALWYAESGGRDPNDVARDIADALDGMVLPGEGSYMLGQVVALATATVPGWMLACDGSEYLRVDYPRLYAVLDASLKTDADHFITPDLPGRTIVGAGTGSGLTPRSQGDIGGSETVTLTVDQMPTHAHSYQMAIFADIDIEGVGVPTPAIGATMVATTGNSGSGDAVSLETPYYVLRYAIIAR